MSTHYSKPQQVSHDMLQAVAPGKQVHLTFHSGAQAHLVRSVADLWQSDWGPISTTTVHQAMDGVHHLEVDD